MNSLSKPQRVELLLIDRRHKREQRELAIKQAGEWVAFYHRIGNNAWFQRWTKTLAELQAAEANDT